jgi:hypothetical protein
VLAGSCQQAALFHAKTATSIPVLAFVTRVGLVPILTYCLCPLSPLHMSAGTDVQHEMEQLGFDRQSHILSNKPLPGRPMPL